MNIDLVMVFMFGLTVGFGHCIGMCGGFVLAYTVRLKKPEGHFSFVKMTIPHLLYSAGRIVTYAFLGGLFGVIGLTFQLFNFQAYLQLLAGVVMLILGAELLGWIPNFSNSKLAIFNPFRKLVGYVMAEMNFTNAFIIGLILGFLPCGPVYVAVTKGISTGSIPGAMLTMIVFGLGTIPALLLVGMGANILSARVKSRLFTLSAILVILLGGYTLNKGWMKLHMPEEKLQKKIEMMHDHHDGEEHMEQTSP